ncbi:MAG: helix-turn-helix domain-containing protein [Colwellia sp.]|jgi:hypothetical protein
MQDIKSVEIYLSPAQAAKKLGVTTRTIERWKLAGKMPQPISINGNPRYLNSEIDAMIRQQNPGRFIDTVTSEAESFVQGL